MIDGRLPSGRHGLSREAVLHSQRDRLLRGMAAAVAARGYAGTRIADVTAIAGVSRRTFYEHFANKEDCFLAAFAFGADLLVARVRAAYEPPGAWPDRLRAGVGALLTGLASEPDFARVCLVEVLAAGPRALELRRHVLDAFAALVRDSQRDSPAPPPPALAYEILVGGICEALYARVQSGHPGDLPALLPELADSALLPLAGLPLRSAGTETWKRVRF
jgi:AcrR family transcriptional regulator